MGLRCHLKVVAPAPGMTSATTYRLAFASGDRRRVDQHFGRCTRFAVFAVDARQSRFIELLRFTELEPAGHDAGKLAARVAALAACAAVYSVALGASAIVQLKAAGVQPVRVPEGVAIAELVRAFQGHVRAGSVDRLLVQPARARDAGRFAAMADEGWQE